MSLDYLAEDYKHTADLLRRYAFGTSQDPALFRAVCSNNLNIILAALEAAELVGVVGEVEVVKNDGDEP